MQKLVIERRTKLSPKTDTLIERCLNQLGIPVYKLEKTNVIRGVRVNRIYTDEMNYKEMK